MVDFKKINTIILHVKEILKNQDSYNIYCDLNDVEYTELSKHFEMKVVSEKKKYKMINFKLKE